MAFKFAQIVAELVESIGFGREAVALENRLQELGRAPARYSPGIAVGLDILNLAPKRRDRHRDERRDPHRQGGAGRPRAVARTARAGLSGTARCRRSGRSRR